MSKKFLGEQSGYVSGVKTVEIEWTNGQGPREIPGTEREWPAQLVLLAMGFVGPEKEGLLSQLGVMLDERGNVMVDEHKMTSVPKVFAAGDMARGQSLVVWAIADGRRAAEGVNRYLMSEATSRLPSV